MKKWTIFALALLVLSGCQTQKKDTANSSKSEDVTQETVDKKTSIGGFTIPNRKGIKSTQAQTMGKLLAKYRGDRLEKNTISIEMHKYSDMSIDIENSITIQDSRNQDEKKVFLANTLPAKNEEELKSQLDTYLKTSLDLFKNMTKEDLSAFPKEVKKILEEQGIEGLSFYGFSADDGTDISLAVTPSSYETGYATMLLFKATGEKLDQKTQVVNLYDYLNDFSNKFYPNRTEDIVILADHNSTGDGDRTKLFEGGQISSISDSVQTKYGLKDAYLFYLSIAPNIESDMDTDALQILFEENIKQLPKEVQLDKEAMLQRLKTGYEEFKASGTVSKNPVNAPGATFDVGMGLTGQNVSATITILVDKDGNVIDNPQFIADRVALPF